MPIPSAIKQVRSSSNASSSVSRGSSFDDHEFDFADAEADFPTVAHAREHVDLIVALCDIAQRCGAGTTIGADAFTSKAAENEIDGETQVDPVTGISPNLVPKVTIDLGTNL